MAYIGTSDLEGENPYYEKFAEYLYGTNGTLGTDGAASLQTDIGHWYSIINDELRATGRFSVLPVQKNPDGSYPQSVKDWNAYLVIYNKLLSRFSGEQDEIPSSISVYNGLATTSAETVKGGGVIFEEEIDAGELGIGRPQISGDLGTDTLGTLHNNWRGYPYGNYYDINTRPKPSMTEFGRASPGDVSEGFTGEDYPRLWVIEIDSAGGIGTATFKWSMNSGKDWEEEEIDTEEDWVGLGYGVYVRFEPASSGTHYFSLSDKWTFNTVPQDIRRVYGSSEAFVTNSRRAW